MSTSLFLLRQVCSAITYKPALEAIVGGIFLPRVEKALVAFASDFPPNVQQYSFTWTNPASLACINFAECIEEFLLDRCISQL